MEAAHVVAENTDFGARGPAFMFNMPLTSHVTLGKLFKSSVSQLPFCKMGIIVVITDGVNAQSV